MKTFSALQRFFNRYFKINTLQNNSSEIGIAMVIAGLSAFFSSDNYASIWSVFVGLVFVFIGAKKKPSRRKRSRRNRH